MAGLFRPITSFTVRETRMTKRFKSIGIRCREAVIEAGKRGCITLIHMQ